MVLCMANSNSDVAGPPGSKRASDTATSPFGSTSIQRGCLRPEAKALIFRPGAALGLWPSSQPLAVGIFSDGNDPCGFAAGIDGAPPMACAGLGVEDLRQRIISDPMSATRRAKSAEIIWAPKLILSDCIGRNARRVSCFSGLQLKMERKLSFREKPDEIQARKRVQLRPSAGS